MNIETKVLITNGSISAEDVMFFVNEGWYWVKEMDANLVHPHALPEDKMSVFVRYKEAKPNNDIAINVDHSGASTIDELENKSYKLKRIELTRKYF